MCLKIYYRIWGVYIFLKMLQIKRVVIPEYLNLQGMEGWGPNFIEMLHYRRDPFQFVNAFQKGWFVHTTVKPDPVSTLRCSPIQSESPDWLEPAARAKPPPLDQDYHDYYYVADVGDHLSIRRPQGKKSAMVFHSRRGGGKTTSSQGPAWLTKGQKSILQAKV